MKKNDVLRNLALGVSAGIPYAGGTLTFLLDKSIPSRIEKSYTEFVTELDKNITELKLEIDQSRFETPQFYSAFVKVLNEVISTHVEGKRKLFQNLLVNTVDSFWDCGKKDYFNMITFRLPLDAFRLLAIYYQGYQVGEKKDELGLGNMIKTIPQDEYYLTSFITELTRFQLLKDGSLSELGRQYCEYIFKPISPGKNVKTYME